MIWGRQITSYIIQMELQGITDKEKLLSGIEEASIFQKMKNRFLVIMTKIIKN